MIQVYIQKKLLSQSPMKCTLAGKDYYLIICRKEECLSPKYWGVLGSCWHINIQELSHRIQRAILVSVLFFFHPADPPGITQGGPPGIPTQLDIFRRGCQRLFEKQSLHYSEQIPHPSIRCHSERRSAIRSFFFVTWYVNEGSVPRIQCGGSRCLYVCQVRLSYVILIRSVLQMFNSCTKKGICTHTSLRAAPSDGSRCKPVLPYFDFHLASHQKCDNQSHGLI